VSGAKAGPQEHQAALRAERLVLEHLPRLARAQVERRPENENLFNNLDDPAEHDLKWHQYGIITHSALFGAAYRSEAAKYLAAWGFAAAVRTKLAQSVDGMSKAQLLHVVFPLHDLGKFARRMKQEDGGLTRDYKGHEAWGEQIIRAPGTVRRFLQEQLALTELQIDYVARCVGLHYELGKVRDAAKQSERGFSMAFSRSVACAETARNIAAACPTFSEEIGLLFLCDNLAKTDVKIEAASDDDIARQAEDISSALKSRGLPAALIAAIMQRPVSLAVARAYFRAVL